MIDEQEWDLDYINNLIKIDEKCESKISLNYDFITEKYFEMYEVALNAGTIMPYRFNSLGVAYKGNKHNRPTKLTNNDPKVKERLEKSYKKRNELAFKYAGSNPNSVERYEKFLDKEIYDFIEEFPQYKNLINKEK